MTELMIISGLVLLICITSSKVLYKFGVPILLIFILLGMLFGSDGMVGIYFDNYELTKQLCSIGLIFIMFFGGFGTNWNMAKPVAVPSILMSSLGVIITAGVTGIFCYMVIGTSLFEGLLIGAIAASTDAASVFAVLRSQKLNLKGSLASLLEVESGSNDPIAYMLTLIILTLMNNSGVELIIPMVIKQITFGLAIGFILAKLSVYILRNSNFEIEGFYTIFITAIALLSYALSEYVGGNGYLSVYISGIIIGNSKIPHKRSLVHFFDGISWIMQIMLFFMLGLLSFPSKLPSVFGIAIAISIFMIIIARPLATFITLAKFKFSNKEKLFISWVGLRGAASVVFAIYAVTQGVVIENDIFHIIFFIALLSVGLQGTLIPTVARKLDLVDDNTPVLKTFNDYDGEISSKLIEVNIDDDSKWADKSIMDSNIPEDILIVMIKRKEQVLVPKGSTVIKRGDTLVLSGDRIEELI
ncbi:MULTISPECIES: potassium/proton antiporter [unclassified Clostridioides]|uniref:potassium/proton antiporter n=1 Tax=unclassified Clostridioides TaxID=2635829 RepID=UPI001D0FB46A|nr:potassium/proton antiporter [Clostridioides sp. ZZV14-6150]MCC0661946.1 potassium/proton antiporter [Clostridioides sp. ZZV14-6154]MCC0670011.1 potassium/proton antiporter [Clostridioides sp. ZZV14-6153]MCC0719190.1 potassium/proton antiporter [Clostridioides sp. ZZV14-6105]MCC0724045.1 potassium/proton antiporter [Clostridioides sp. ZZV14-6104]MCC0726116.1 potassium/proton antiporter [Clostridioides sp. ZZV14-6045]MCC0730853.1 potassium/proton antiporter [Clostridioides sp. ZZV14-6048]MC